MANGYFASIYALERHSGRWHKWHFLSYIRPHSKRGSGGEEGPDQELPGGEPGRPDHGFEPGGPDQGFNPDAPDQGLPGRPPWEKPDWEFAWPPRPTDPDWGVDAPVTPEHPIYIDDVTGEGPDHGLPPGRPPRPDRPDREKPDRERPPHASTQPLPPGRPGAPTPGAPDQGLPAQPGQPDQGLPAGGRPSTQPLPPGGRPPTAGRPARPGGGAGTLPEHGGPDHELPPTDPPPGTIWPPLPDDAPPGKHAFLFYIQGVGYRYGVLEVPEHPGHKPEVEPAKR